MLSKDDIQQIREVVREEVSTQVDPLKEDMVFVKKSLRGLKMKTTKIKNTLDVAIDMFDRHDIENKKRIGKIEQHVGISA